MPNRIIKVTFQVSPDLVSFKISGFYNQLGSNKLKQDLNDFLQPQSYGIPKVVAGTEFVNNQ